MSKSTSGRIFQRCSAIALLAAALCLPLRAATAPDAGSLQGRVLCAALCPHLAARVSVRTPQGEHVALLPMDDTGLFRASTLTAGTYVLQVVEEGQGKGTAKSITVTPGHQTSVELALQSEPIHTAGLALKNDFLPQSSSSTPAAPAPTPKLDNSFMHRLGRTYAADWAGNPPVALTKEPRRDYPPPLFSPPYPASDWPIGGTPTIEVPDGQTYPLMQAINQNRSQFKMYGWMEIGANGSTNNKTNASKGIASNAPSAYDVYANTVQLDQAALYLEKYPNTAQTDHFEWGYRATLLYGTDYRFTTAKGLLSQQLLLKNNQYGFDPVMMYLDFYIPQVGHGLNIRAGRYVSLPDIEAQLAPNNYSYSHSILYTYDCYTQTGVNATLKANDHWTIQGGVSAGCDAMPWTTDAKLTGNLCVTYTWSHGANALNTCANSLNDSKYAYNNLAAYYMTYYHRINASWHTDSEVWYQYEREVPNMYWFDAVNQNTSTGQYLPTAKTPWPETTYRGLPDLAAHPNAALPVNLNFGAVCTDPRKPVNLQPSRCYAPEYAFTNYVEHNFWNNTASLNIRNEFVNDIKGQRTGTPAIYEEHMVGFDFWAGTTITFRPELSYTHAFTRYGVSGLNISPGASISNLEGVSQGAAPNPLGLGKNQALTLSADLIWHF